jgi:ribosomal protein S18 acetylase RimI-like enzyme
MLLATAKEAASRFFRPHPFTRECLDSLASAPGLDLYYVLTEGDSIRGYGLLRGWNEGYEVPSLGILIHQSARGLGFGRLLMTFLHTAAFRHGASRVRLRVHHENYRAIALYRSMKYQFADTPDDAGLLVGIASMVDRDR